MVREDADVVDVVEVISGVLMASWRFIKFTTSRWLTVGKSARSLTAAIALGIDSLVDFIKEAKQKELFYLKGFGRLKGPLRSFVVASAISSRVAESFQLLLMEDPRVALRYEELWQCMSEELRWLIDIDLPVWQQLSYCCEQGVSSLRHTCIQSAHIAYHFVWRRVLSVAKDYPWKLCRGDIEGNLVDLKNGDRPTEQVSGQLWELLHLGYPMVHLVQSVRLMGEVSWSTMPAEQQHGTMSMYHRWHPGYGSEFLATRTLIMQMSRLLPSQSKEERTMAAIMRQLTRLQHADSRKVTGRHEFLAGLVRVALKRQSEDNDGDVTGVDRREKAKHWFGRHAVLWAKQSLRAKATWRRQAKQTANAKKEANESNIAKLETEMELLKNRMEETQSDQGVPPLTMSSAAWSEEQCALFASLFNSPKFSAGVPQARADLGCSKPWRPEYIKELDKYKVSKYEDPKQPAWVGAIVESREFLKDAILVLKTVGQEDRHFRILYGVQNPHYLALCPVTPMPTEPAVREDGEPMEAFLERSSRFLWSCNFADLRTAADLPRDITQGNFDVVLKVRYEGGTALASNMQPMPLKPFLAGAVDPKEVEGETSRKKDDEHFEEMVAELPWLGVLDKQQGFASSSTRAGGEEKRHRITKSDESEDEEDKDEERVLDALTSYEKAMEAVVGHLDVAGNDFKTKVRRPDEKAADALQAIAATHIATEWCRRRKLQVTFKMTILTHTLENSELFCRAWSHRMQYFLELEMASPEGCSLKYTAEHCRCYQEPVDFTAATIGVLGGKTMERARFIRNILFK